MNLKRITVVIGFFTLLMLSSVYYYLYKKRGSEIVTLAPDTDLIKKKPEERGGIVIPNSDSLVYEKLQSGVKKNRKINILPDPEEPININVQEENDNSVISLDAIDEILSNSEYYDLYANNEVTNNIDEYIIPNILKNQNQTQDQSIDENSDQNINIIEEDKNEKKISNSMLNIVKYDDNHFNTNIKNVVKDENEGYKIQLSVASSQSDANKRWHQIVNNHNKILYDANLITKKIEGANNRIFYMILAGTYPSLNHAKLTCRRLIKRKQNCIVVK